jgi:hypothetical protein
MKLLRNINLVLIVVFLLFLAGCGIRLYKGSEGNPSPGAQTGGISLRIVWPENSSQRMIPSATNSVKIRIIKGQNVLLTDVVTRQAGQTEVKRTYKNIPVGDVIFEASAYASQDGTGIALAKGSTTVQITIGTYAQVNLTMESTIAKVEVSPPEATLSVGQTLQLTATAKDADGNIVLVPEGGFSWQSSNSAVAEVDSGGKVTTKAEGSATITATEKESGKSGNASIKVESTPSVITFERTFGGSDDDWGWSVAQTSDGEYIVVGTTFSFGVGGGDIYLIKTDSKGYKAWDKTFGGIYEDWGGYVVQTSDGGYIIVGSTESFGSGYSDVYLIKTDSKGNKMWEQVFGGNNNEWGYSVAQTNDSGYIIVGYTESFGSGGSDVYLIKTDSKGNLIWQKTFGGSDYDYGYSVAQTSDGGYIIAGETFSFGSGKDDVYLIKTDSKGNLIWQQTFGGSNDDWGYSVAQTSDGGYIIVGGTYSFGSGDRDVYLIKTDSKGNKTWEQIFGGSYNDDGFSVAQTKDGGYVIVGETCSFGTGYSNVYLIKTDSKGNKTWEQIFGGGIFNNGYSVAQTSDGGYIIVGETKSFGSGGYDVYLIKTDSKGNVYNKGKSFANPAVGNKPGSRGYNQMDRRERFGHRLGRD